MKLTRTELLTVNDVMEGSRYTDYTDQWLVISPERVKLFKSEYQNIQSQVFKAFGGFGCNPNAMGNAVMGEFPDGERCRMERYDFIGIIKPEVAAELGLA